MIIRDIEQGSEEWKQLRVGCVTASQLWRLMPGASGYTKERDNYMSELACETISGLPYEHFVSKEMNRGSELEFLARAEYEAKTGRLVEEVTIAEHDIIKNFKASPDGLTPDGCIEIKCPNTANHFKTLVKGFINKKYNLQMHAVMMCCNVGYCDYISFDDRVPDKLALYINRIDRDNYLCAEIEPEVIKFNSELSEYVKTLEGLNG